MIIPSSVGIYENKELRFTEHCVEVEISTIFSKGTSVPVHKLTLEQCNEICKKGKIDDDSLISLQVKKAITVSSSQLRVGSIFSYVEFVELLADNYKLYVDFMKSSKMVYNGKNIFIRKISLLDYKEEFNKIFWMLTNIISESNKPLSSHSSIGGTAYIVFRKNMVYNKIFLRGFDFIQLRKLDKEGGIDAISVAPMHSNFFKTSILSIFAIMDKLYTKFSNKIYCREEMYRNLPMYYGYDIDSVKDELFVTSLLDNIFYFIPLEVILGSEFRDFCVDIGLTNNIIDFLYNQVFGDVEFLENLKKCFANELEVGRGGNLYEDVSVSMFNMMNKNEFNVRADCHKHDGFFGNFNLTDFIYRTSQVVDSGLKRRLRHILGEHDRNILYSDILAFSLGYMIRFNIPLVMNDIDDKSKLYLMCMRDGVVLDHPDYFSVYDNFYDITEALSSYYFIPASVNDNKEVYLDLSARFSNDFINKYWRAIINIYHIKCNDMINFFNNDIVSLLVDNKFITYKDDKDVRAMANTLYDIQKSMIFDIKKYDEICSEISVAVRRYSHTAYYLALLDDVVIQPSSKFKDFDIKNVNFSYSVLFFLGSLLQQFEFHMPVFEIECSTSSDVVKIVWKVSAIAYGYDESMYFELPQNGSDAEKFRKIIITVSLGELLRCLKSNCDNPFIDESNFDFDFNNEAHEVIVTYTTKGV